jgi:FMN reductase
VNGERAVRGVGVVVGNPKPRSRTLDVARAVAAAAAQAVGLPTGGGLVVDLADLGPQLLDWSSTAVKETVDAVSAQSLLIVASPTYKAAYTGLLKCFLDWFGTTGLAGVTTVPVMVGAGPAHALAVEVHLRPVLVEIGATLPTRGLYVLEQELPDLDAVIARWLEGAEVALRRSLSPAAGSSSAVASP